MNKGICVVTFVLGAAVGSIATWKWLEKKYERVVQEEIDSVKELYSYKKPECDSDENSDETLEEIAKRAIDKPCIMNYASKIGELAYGKLENKAQSIYPGHQDEAYYTSDDKDAMYIDPYVISPEEFGDEDEYEKINLTYYSDGVLTDENDEVVDNVDATVGLDSLDTFGRFEDDSVHVKNDRLKCYYEILRDERNYEDVMAGKPHPTDFYE